ncbi:MAG TPA: CocE/NonD family hydrolase [Amycolatopsis sp.]|nr:CocE/NonD family hydrolase [Amycolatopsis sp.]
MAFGAVTAVVVLLAAPAGQTTAAGAPATAGQVNTTSAGESLAVYAVGEQKNVPVTMDDGVVLRVNVKYPEDPATKLPAAGPFPSLLTQTPYGKDSPLLAALGGGTEDYLVQRGYVAVIADVRGRGASPGSFDLWGRREAKDGAQLAEWASKLPSSNGKVGLYGGSYMGITQLMTESEAGPDSPIKAAVPIVSINDAAQDGLYGGLPNLGFGLLYAGLFPATGVTGVADRLDPTDPVDVLERTVGSLTGSLDLSLPLLTGMVTGGPASQDSSFWIPREPHTYLRQIAQAQIPTFIVGGWYDIMGTGPSTLYTGLQNIVAGRPQDAPMAPNQVPDPRYQFLSGPWTHSAAINNSVVDQVQLLWFDHWLKGADNGVADSTDTVHFNTLDTDSWNDASTWPLSQTTPATYYLGGRDDSSPALSLNHGGLTTAPPTATSGADQVAWTGLSDPCSVRLKVQTAGLLDMAGLPLDKVCGSYDDSLTEVGGLTYTTPAATTPKVVAGPIGVTLYASSTRPDAEFVVGVSKIEPDGRSESITSGALIGSQRAEDPDGNWAAANGQMLQPRHILAPDTAVPLTPGQVTRFDIGIRPAAFQLNPGERLRITITTSDIPFAFPSTKMVPNLVGGIYSIQHTAQYPSSVTVMMADPSTFAPCSICAAK